MKNKFQSHYDTLIRQANLAYVQSQEPMFAALSSILLAKAEAFEDAASLFGHHFPVKTTTTMRFNDIREHHMSECETEPKEKQV